MQFILPFQLETEKNKLENVLNNNLTKKRERLQQELREVSIEEQDKRLTGYRQDKEEVVQEELQAVEAGASSFLWDFHLCLIPPSSSCR